MRAQTDESSLLTCSHEDFTLNTYSFHMMGIILLPFRFNYRIILAGGNVGASVWSLFDIREEGAYNRPLDELALFRHDYNQAGRFEMVTSLYHIDL